MPLTYILVDHLLPPYLHDITLIVYFQLHTSTAPYLRLCSSLPNFQSSTPLSLPISKPTACFQSSRTLHLHTSTLYGPKHTVYLSNSRLHTSTRLRSQTSCTPPCAYACIETPKLPASMLLRLYDRIATLVPEFQSSIHLCLHTTTPTANLQSFEAPYDNTFASLRLQRPVRLPERHTFFCLQACTPTIHIHIHIVDKRSAEIHCVWPASMRTLHYNMYAATNLSQTCP